MAPFPEPCEARRGHGCGGLHAGLETLRISPDPSTACHDNTDTARNQKRPPRVAPADGIGLDRLLHVRAEPFGRGPHLRRDEVRAVRPQVHDGGVGQAWALLQQTLQR